MAEKEFYLNNNGRLFVKKWISETEKAVIQIIHGLGEYTLYYEEFAQYANNNNISVYIFDLIGHGKTEKTINCDNVCDSMIEDCRYVTQHIRKNHSSPLFILGHSMGSTLAQLYLKKYNDIQGVILTGLAEFPDLDKNLLTIKREIDDKGQDAPSKETFLELFGKVAQPFKETCTISWVTSDLEKALEYERSPHSNVMYPNCFYKSFLETTKMVQDKEFLKSISTNTPVLFMSGSMDTVGDFGKYAVTVYEQYLSAGFSDITYKIYENFRHSILQEVGRDIVSHDICQWIKQRS